MYCCLLTDRLVADLDSLCSALLVAYLRTNSPPHKLHIPLCHIPRDDLTLRPEFTAVLKDAGSSPEDVLTLSELPDAEDLKPDDTEWFLVDHNVMPGKLGQLYSNRIIGCIDHHADEGHVPKGCEIRVIEQSGSCISLVVAHYATAWDALPPSETDRQLAHLALGPILIDTANLGDKNKTTAFDEDAVRHLEAKLESTGYDRTAFYTHVSDLKDDLSPLSLRDILRKDYKEWQGGGLKLGTSSAPQGFDSLVQKAGGADGLLEALSKWGDEMEIDLVALMTGFKEGDEFRRELLVWARTPKAVDVAVGFENECRAKLELDTWGDGKLDTDKKDEWGRCWTQGKVENSRKQIAPLLRDAMKATGKA
jgi:exopolyphosphatase